MSIKALGLISANYNSQDFGSLTEKRTVATLPYGGRYRIIDFPLSNMVNSGITTVGLITPYYYRSIMDHVGVGKPWGLARKIGGLFVLPGSAIGERSKGSKILMKDLIRNRRILDSCKADYVILTDSSTVMNCDYQAFLKAHVESEAQISLMYAKKKSTNEGIYLDLTKSGALKGIRLYGEEFSASTGISSSTASHGTKPSTMMTSWRYSPTTSRSSISMYMNSRAITSSSTT